MKIEIDALPDEMLQKLTGHGLTAPNACFQNCFSTTVVFGDAVSGGMHYVLCWLVDKFQTRHLFRRAVHPNSPHLRFWPSLNPHLVNDVNTTATSIRSFVA